LAYESGSYDECTLRLPEDASRVFEAEDLLSLSSMPPFMLVDDGKRVLESMMVFRRRCYRTLSREEYESLWSVFNGALLKIAAAIEDAGALDADPVAKQIVGMFTEDERAIVREFERFSKLDPEVTPPERLADLIVSRSGEIYELVAEAVRKQYVDFSGLVKTWKTRGNVRDPVSRALQMRYERRFRNIVEAVKRLLDQQPAWLLRLFTDYERALLESAELRESIERELREKVERELGLPQLRARLDELRREREELYRRLEETAAQLAAQSVEREQALRALEELRRERDALASRGEKLERHLSHVRQLLAESMNRLREKEEELRRLSEEHSRDRAAKEALEAEAERLRAKVEELEETLREYEAAAQSVAAEKAALEAKLGEIEDAISGRGESRLVTAEEALAYEAMFIERFNYHMNRLPLTLYDPLRGEEVRVAKWDKGDWVSFASNPDGPGPKGRVSRYTVSAGLLRRRPRLVVEAVSFARPEPYALEGRDTQPMSLSEALELAGERAEKARSGGYYHVLLISSPTGFSSRLRDYVAGTEFHRVFLSSHLALALFDPVTGEVYHHPEDPTVEKLRAVLTPLASFEEIASVASKVLELEAEATARFPTRPYMTLGEIVKRTGARPEVVRAALARLEAEGKGYVALHRGEPVFFYGKRG